MVSITTSDSSHTYDFPYSTQVMMTKETGIIYTSMPTYDEGVILNFGGGTLRFDLKWVTKTQADVMELINYFATASEPYTYTIDFTAEWGTGASFNGLVESLVIQQEAGQLIWNCEMIFDVGTIEIGA